MSENLNSKNIENDESNRKSPDIDYKDLINRLKEIKSTMDCLGKTMLKKI